jgi:hypothetical protein
MEDWRREYRREETAKEGPISRRDAEHAERKIH